MQSPLDQRRVRHGIGGARMVTWIPEPILSSIEKYHLLATEKVDR